MRKQLSQDENKASVGTLARGLDILELFAGESPELTQTEISDRLGLPVPTVHRLVKLLTERGWLVRDPATRRLRLGLGAARLLPAVRLPEPCPRAAADAGRAHRRDREPGDARRQRGPLSAERDREPPSDAPLARGPSPAGARHGSREVPAGAARRRRGPRGGRRRAIRALTDRTVTGWSKLRANLERIRREGVAFSREEYEIGLCSVAVPLDWVQGDGPVAVNVSLPASRAGRDATAGLVRELRAAGRDHGRRCRWPRTAPGGARGSGRVTPGTRPFWLDAPYEPRPALDRDLEVEACVIGGGVGGLSCARRLAENGVETVLLEAGTVAGGASGRNGGFLITGTAAFHNDARERFGVERARAMYAATLEAQRDVIALAAGARAPATRSARSD